MPSPAVNLILRGSYCQEAQTLFAAFTTKPSSTRKKQINTLIRALKAATVWDKLDVLYVFAAHDSPGALINWKKPGTFNATIAGSLTFTVDRGYTGGDAATNYLDAIFNPTTAPLANYVQDSASYGVWKLANAQDANQMMNGGANISFYPRYTDDKAYIRVNQVTEEATGASTDSTGLWGLSRTVSTAALLYRNGALFFTGAQTSGVLTNNGFIVSYGAAAFIGSGFTAAQQSAFYQALLTYMQGVGAV